MNEIIQKQLKNKGRKSFIGKLWISNCSSSTIIIPKILAENYGLTEPCHVLFEPVKDGICLRKILE